MLMLHKQPHHSIVTCQPLSFQGRLVSSGLRMDFELLEPPSCLLTWGSRSLPPYPLPSCDLIFFMSNCGKGEKSNNYDSKHVCNSHNHLWCKCYYSYLIDEEIEAEIKLSKFTQLPNGRARIQTQAFYLGLSRVYAVRASSTALYFCPPWL